MVQPGWPSLVRGKGCPETCVGPSIRDPVNVTFCLAARMSLKRAERYPPLSDDFLPFVMESPKGRILQGVLVGQGLYALVPAVAPVPARPPMPAAPLPPMPPLPPPAVPESEFPAPPLPTPPVPDVPASPLVLPPLPPDVAS